MADAKVIKTIEPIICPLCKGTFLHSSQMMPPSNGRDFTLDESKEAKKEMKKRLVDIKFKDAATKKEIISWLDNEETFIEVTDVETFLRQILEQESEVK